MAGGEAVRATCGDDNARCALPLPLPRDLPSCGRWRIIEVVARPSCVAPCVCSSVDRALASGARGRRFESCQAYHRGRFLRPVAEARDGPIRRAPCSGGVTCLLAACFGCFRGSTPRSAITSCDRERGTRPASAWWRPLSSRLSTPPSRTIGSKRWPNSASMYRNAAPQYGAYPAIPDIRTH